MFFWSYWLNAIYECVPIKLNHKYFGIYLFSHSPTAIQSNSRTHNTCKHPHFLAHILKTIKKENFSQSRLQKSITEAYKVMSCILTVFYFLVNKPNLFRISISQLFVLLRVFCYFGFFFNVSNNFKGNGLKKNSMIRRTYVLEASCSWAFLHWSNHEQKAKSATSRKLKNHRVWDCSTP